jgi:hypothetical protein
MMYITLHVTNYLYFTINAAKIDLISLKSIVLLTDVPIIFLVVKSIENYVLKWRIIMFRLLLITDL